MEKGRNNLRRSLRIINDFLLALRQSNITVRQLPKLMRQWRTWLQLTNNVHVIEGSWWTTFRRFLKMFQGHPR